MVTLEQLRQVVIDEAKRMASGDTWPMAWPMNDDHPLRLAVRALERHELRIAQLDTQLDAENAKVVPR